MFFPLTPCSYALAGLLFRNVVFPCRLLAEKDIFSEKSIGGKRAFRVYAPWVMPSAAQAKRAKIWQCAHFAELTDATQGLAQLAKLL